MGMAVLAFRSRKFEEFPPFCKWRRRHAAGLE
jgi:hypothetical protein